jgi:hypothetical protein
VSLVFVASHQQTSRVTHRHRRKRVERRRRSRRRRGKGPVSLF